MVSHIYSAPGNYSVVLTVTDNAGRTGTLTQLVEVLGNQLAVPEIQVDATSFTAPATVSFDGSGSRDPDGSIASYHWDFGDGDIGQGPAVSHTYQRVDTYTVTLTLTDSDGELSSATTSVQIVAPPSGAFSLSGRVTASAQTAVDTDTNDPFSTEISNDSTGQAQALASQVNVSGFVAKTATGNTDNGDRFASQPDRSDFYRATLTQGQKIYLEIGDWADTAVDLDLYLFDSLGNQLAFSVGESDTEMVTVPLDGDYLIEVVAYSGFSNYQLSLERPQSAARAGVGAMSDRAPARAGEIIVDYAGSLVLGRSGTAARAAQKGLTLSRGEPGGPTLNHFALSAPAAEDRYLTSIQLSPYVPRTAAELQAYRDRYQTFMKIKALRADAQVRSASANYAVKPYAIPSDPRYIQQWHYPLINLPQAWDVATGAGVIVAVVDTGVYLAHEDLSGQLLPGYDFISDANNSLDGDGMDSNPDDPGDGGVVGASSWHGTHVAGTVAAATNNTTGGAGVAYGAKVMPLRALGKEGGSTFDIQQAVLYAARLANASGELPDQRAHVLNLSLGCQFCFSASEQSVYQQARDAGVIIIAAAGNESSTDPSYPAAYAGVVSVSATDRFDNIAPYSNTGTTIDIAAPGGAQQSGAVNGVLSTLVDESSGQRRSSYAFYQGTSMAAPHVAGVAALMVSIYPSLTPAEFDGAISSGAIVDDKGAIGRDNSYGYGRINALKAVEHATDLAGGTLPATLVASESAIDFGSNLDLTSVEITKQGSGSVRVLATRTSASWLSVAAESVDADGLGSYQISVERSGLPDGPYQGSVTFTADSGTELVIQVSMYQGLNVSTEGAGHLWILLLNEDFALVDQVDLEPDLNGNYDYQFTGVPAGDYYLVAGTDSDNDLVLCDAGEVCGAYPTVGLASKVRLTADTSGADFLVLMGSALAREASASQQSLSSGPVILRRP